MDTLPVRGPDPGTPPLTRWGGVVVVVVVVFIVVSTGVQPVWCGGV